MLFCLFHRVSSKAQRREEEKNGGGRGGVGGCERIQYYCLFRILTVCACFLGDNEGGGL